MVQNTLLVIDPSIIVSKYDSNIFDEPIPNFLKHIIINTDNGCWEWTSYKNKCGYGCTGKKGYDYLAHRFLYRYYYGEIDENLTIDHLCNNTVCVNIFHMKQVTQRANMLRGNCQSIRNANKMECKRGHPFDFSNTYINPGSGARQCRICRYEYSKKIRLGLI